MQARLRITALGLGLAFALTVGVAPALAGFNATVTETSSSAAGGLTMYSYTITDLATSTENVSEFDLIVPTNASLTSFHMPAGFINLYTAGNVDLSFQSTASSSDLTPGQSGTFSFLSPDKPGQTTYSLTDLDDGGTATGSVMGPSAVPEPGSFVLLGIGLPLAIAMLARRRSRKLADSPVRPA